MGVEVEHQDDAKGGLPGQAQATNNVNHAGAEPGDEPKLFVQQSRGAAWDTTAAAAADHNDSSGGIGVSSYR